MPNADAIADIGERGVCREITLYIDIDFVCTIMTPGAEGFAKF